MRIFSLLLILALALFASPEAAKELGYHSDYNRALSIAKKEKKPLMLVVVTSYCPWCRKFERKTLASKTIAPMVKSIYIPVIVDRNKDAEMFPKKFQTPRIPTVFFVDPKDEKEYWESIGYLNKKEFSEALKDAESLFKKRQK
ncbi:MAG: thioredoxin family protein [Sulfurimonadaceae bacterium]